MINVLQPQPDQTIESLVALSTLWSGQPVGGGGDRAFSESLLRKMRGFCTPRLMATYMLLGRHWFGSTTTLLERHAYVVVLKPFIERASYDRLSTDLLLDRQPGTMHVTSRNRVRAALHFCPQCVDAELMALGFSYAHRSHQIAGVYVCARHGIRLRQLQPDGRNWFAEHGVLTEFPVNSVDLCGVDDVSHSNLRNYAEFVAAALDDSLPVLPHSTRVALCHRRLTGEGRLQNTNSQVRHLYRRAADAYGVQFLEEIGATWLSCAVGSSGDPAIYGGRFDSAFGIGIALLASSFGRPHHFRAATYERFDLSQPAPSETSGQPGVIEDQAMVA